MDNESVRHGKRSGVFSMQLSTLAIVLMCVTVASLASLVVVATTKEADALSTVALALAVLAFAAQLIVTITQAQSSAEQTRDTFRINSETKAVLADIQAQAKALVALQSNQFDKLLDRAINVDTISAAIADVAGDDDRNGEHGSALGEAAPDASAIAAALRSNLESKWASGLAPKDEYTVTRRIGREEAGRTVDRFLSLSGEAQSLLMKLVSSVNRNRTPILSEGSSLTATAEELERAKFIEINDVLSKTADGSQARLIFVSDRGRLIEELFDSENKVSWAKGLRMKLERASI